MKKTSAAIIGLGLSGEAAAELLLREGAAVSVFDDRAGPPQQDRARRLSARGAEVRLGGAAEKGWRGYETVVVSPGIPPGHRLLVRARRAGVPVISEVELASRFLPGRLVAVTGTNGKTTTVSLLVEIFRRAGRPAVAGGNIGYPLSRIALEEAGDRMVVAEISSFQLENVETFRPGTAVFLNLTPDHLDRYPSMKEYGESKLKIFARQGKGDRAVFPGELAAFLAEAIPPGVEIITWGGPEGITRLEEGQIRAYLPEGRRTVCPGEAIARRGPAFLDNALAAAAAALAEGVAAEDIGAVLNSFPALPHRLEYLGKAGGVGFYNDSKSTNPAAAAAALEAFSRPVFWLAGGSDKGLDFSRIGPILPGPVKRVLLLGENREKLGRVVEGKVPFRYVSSLPEAVAEAFRAAEPGDVILLSPGSASFDMFENYRDRGDRFKALVRELASRTDSDTDSDTD